MVRRSFIVGLLMTMLTAGWVTAAAASPSAESSMISLINSERSSRGLGTMCSHGGLTSFTRGHTADMIAEGSIFHSSNLGSAASGWTAMGENVGMGPNVNVLHNAFMNSSGHRANVLGDYNHVGVGIALSDNGTMFVTVVFMKAAGCGGATTTTTASPATTTTTAAPATTTTTAAPVTTTTSAAPATTTTTAASAVADRTVQAPIRPTLEVPVRPMLCRAVAYQTSPVAFRCVD